jgi:hypothetical protein
MKNKIQYFSFILLALMFMSSCASLREKKAENHQPFSPHKNKKQKQGHPSSQQHHH